MTPYANFELAIDGPKALLHNLRAGQVVLSGALGPMVASPPGSVVSAELGPLGSVGAVFSATDRA